MSDPSDAKDPTEIELRQAPVCGQVTTLGSLEITAASEIIASMAFGNSLPPEPEPAKKPTKPDDEDDERTFHGAEDYR